MFVFWCSAPSFTPAEDLQTSRTLTACTHQTVVGGAISGKTNLLSQFARRNSKTSICYFVDSSPISRTLHSYLFSVCSQIAELLGKPEPPDDISVDELKNRYSSLSTNLLKHASKSNTKFYYVIDGIEQFTQGVEGNRILDYFPPRLGPGVYLLSSLFEDKRDDFVGSHVGKVVNVRPFEIHESERFLSALGLSFAQIRHVHSASQGLAGYLRAIKQARIIDSTFDVDHPPVEITELISRQFSAAQKALTDTQINILRYLSAVPGSIPIVVIADLCNDFDEARDIGALSSKGLAQIQAKSNEVGIPSILLRETAAKHLAPNQTKLADVLLHSAQRLCPDNTSLINLLLKVSRNSAAAHALLSPETVASTFQSSASAISDLIVRTRITTDLAKENEHISELIDLALLTGIRKSFVSHVSERPEIEALIALKHYDLAYNRVRSIPDDFARIIALCQVLTAEVLDRIPGQIGRFDELREILSRIPLETLDRESIEQLATELFPLLPDESDRLLQRLETADWTDVIGSESTGRDGDASKEGQSRIVSVITKRLGQEAVRSFGDNWIASLGYTELVSELERVHSKTGKLRMLRRWCEAQKPDVDITDAANMWVSQVVESSELSIPMSGLRSLAEALRIRKDRFHVEATAIRIERLTTALPIVPYEEWIRCRMAIAEISAKNDLNAAMEFIQDVVKTVIGSALDLDVLVFCLARTWLAAKRIGALDSDSRLAKIRDDFQTKFAMLLASSAEHLDLLGPTIQVLTEIDPEIALIAANELNTRSRRSTAISSVLLRLANDQMDIDISRDLAGALLALRSIDVLLHDIVLSRMLARIRAQSTAVCADNYAILSSAVDKCDSPRMQARMYADLLVVAKTSGITATQSTQAALMDAWKRVSDLPEQIVTGYAIVAVLASAYPIMAETLYTAVFDEANSDVGNLSQGELGYAHQRLVETAIRSLRHSDLDDAKSVLNEFERRVERMVTPEIQVSVFTKLASRFAGLGHQKLANDVVRDKLLPAIDRIDNIEARDNCILCASPMVYEYDPVIAQELLNRLSLPDRQAAVASNAIWLLTHHYLGDPSPDPERIKIVADYQHLRNSVKLLQELRFDTDFYSTVSAITSAIHRAFEGRRVDLPQSIDLLTTITQAIDANLPDSNNIRHDGFAILSRLRVAQCRTSIYIHQQNGRFATRLRTKDLQSEWEVIVTQARGIPNVADKVLVLADIARAYGELPRQNSGEAQLIKSLASLAKGAIDAARSELLNIPTLIDRCGRMVEISQAYASMSNTDEATALLDDLTKHATNLRGATRDEISSACIQAAFRTSPDYAERLAQELNTRSGVGASVSVNADITVRKLISNPGHLASIDVNTQDLSPIISRSARACLGEISCGPIRTPSAKLGVSWLVAAQLCDSPALFNVVDWAVEVFRQQVRMDDVLRYQPLLRKADLAMLLAQVGTSLAARSIGEVGSARNGSRRVTSYAQGDGARAIEAISEWLVANAKTYLTICDPYFEYSDLKILMPVPMECSVTIVTCDRKIKGSPHEIESEIKKEWARMSLGQMPELVIHVVSSGELGSFHDRAFATDNAVLQIGQSLNGLGHQIGSISELYGEEAEEYEREYIERMLSPSYWSRKQVKYTRVQVRSQFGT